ncbi:hypothetical protein M1N66_02930 [Thermodesulfovibrionales bacterium]|nr:hypothetical protein [Thermodesulfovibrionales bacterium]
METIIIHKISLNSYIIGTLIYNKQQDSVAQPNNTIIRKEQEYEDIKRECMMGRVYQ